jgi:hypothetical protein
MSNPLLINGRRYSFASLEFSILKPSGASEIFIDIDSISYEHSLTIEFVPGTSQAPVGWTSGVYEPKDGSFSLAKSSFTRLVQDIGNGWMGANVKFVLNYADEGEPLTTDTIIARLSGVGNDHSAGPSALKVTVAFKPILIKEGGITPLANHLI